jgi:acetyl-CoA carboxylase biotin carboxyl carrier protein
VKIDDVRQLSAWLAATDIELLELRGPEHHLCLRCNGEQVEVVATEAGAPEVCAPPSFAVAASGVGVFLHGHPLAREPLVRSGERVREGQVLALLKIGALLVPVNAPRDGVFQRPLVADGAPVGFGTPVLEMSAL